MQHPRAIGHALPRMVLANQCRCTFGRLVAGIIELFHRATGSTMMPACFVQSHRRHGAKAGWMIMRSEAAAKGQQQRVQRSGARVRHPDTEDAWKLTDCSRHQ